MERYQTITGQYDSTVGQWGDKIITEVPTHIWTLLIYDTASVTSYASVFVKMFINKIKTQEMKVFPLLMYFWETTRQ